MTGEIDPAVTAAVVDICAVTGAAVPGVTFTEAGTVQTVGAVTAGVTVQLRLTIPLNDAAGVTARLNDAACPAVMVAELEDPLAVAISKSAAAVAVPDRATVCGLLTALSAIFMPAVALPAAVGLKMTLMVQFAPG